METLYVQHTGDGSNNVVSINWGCSHSTVGLTTLFSGTLEECDEFIRKTEEGISLKNSSSSQPSTEKHAL